MRTMMRWSIPVEKGNEVIKNGSLDHTVQKLIQELKPEATYFWTENGERAGMMVFDMKDPAQIPAIAEPLFMTADAAVDLCPVMNNDDLQKALAALQKD